MMYIDLYRRWFGSPCTDKYKTIATRCSSTNVGPVLTNIDSCKRWAIENGFEVSDFWYADSISGVRIDLVPESQDCDEAWLQFWKV